MIDELDIASHEVKAFVYFQECIGFVVPPQKHGDSHELLACFHVRDASLGMTVLGTEFQTWPG